MPKYEHQVEITQPVQLYGWKTAPVRIAVDEDGYLRLSASDLLIITSAVSNAVFARDLTPPTHDTQTVDTSVSGVTTITYSLSGSTVGTKTITVSGTTTTITLSTTPVTYTDITNEDGTTVTNEDGTTVQRET